MAKITENGVKTLIKLMVASAHKNPELGNDRKRYFGPVGYEDIARGKDAKKIAGYIDTLIKNGWVLYDVVAGTVQASEAIEMVGNPDEFLDIMLEASTQFQIQDVKNKIFEVDRMKHLFNSIIECDIQRHHELKEKFAADVIQSGAERVRWMLSELVESEEIHNYSARFGVKWEELGMTDLLVAEKERLEARINPEVEGKGFISDKLVEAVDSLIKEAGELKEEALRRVLSSESTSTCQVTNAMEMFKRNAWRKISNADDWNPKSIALIESSLKSFSKKLDK